MSDGLIVLGPVTAPVRKGDLAAVGLGATAAAKCGGAFDILLLGPRASAAAAGVTRLGARRVYTLEHAGLESYTAEAHAAALAAFLKEHPYRLVVASTSSSTREYFPRVAVKLDWPMASDVLALDDLEDRRAVFTRAVFVGNLLATVELEGPAVLVTCRASEFEPPGEQESASPVEAVSVADELDHPGKRFVSLSHAESERPDLGEADIVVTAGRGTRGPDEGLPLVEKLADLLGAALGSTRAVVDAGWLPNEFQVGQTGKIVAPKLYVAVGVSGAIQHLAGMRNSKTVAAINKDPDAPIFEVADLGLVADLFEAVPRILEAVREHRGT